MSEVQVKANFGFQHYDKTIARNQEFFVSRHTAEDFERRGMVRVLSDIKPKNPKVAGGRKSSASPAAQVSEQKMSKKQSGGGKKKPVEPSLL